MIYKHLLLFSLGLFLLPPHLQATQYRDKKDKKRPQLVVAGSVSCKTAFVAPYARKFAKTHKLDVRVYSGGSEAGIEAVYAGVADMAVATRFLTEEERKKGLRDSLLAFDAIAVVVHRSNPIEGLSMKDMQKILRRKIKSWKTFGWHDLPISLILPDTGSAIRRVFLQRVLRDKKMKLIPKEGVSTYGAISLLQKDTLAIAICSLSQAKYAHMKVIAVDQILPAEETIRDQTYPLWIPITLITRGAVRENPMVSRFASWLLEGPPSRLLAKYFYVPAMEKPREQWTE